MMLADVVEEQRVVPTFIQVLDLNVRANRFFLANRQLGKRLLVLKIVGQRWFAVYLGFRKLFLAVREFIVRRENSNRQLVSIQR